MNLVRGLQFYGRKEDRNGDAGDRLLPNVDNVAKALAPPPARRLQVPQLAIDADGDALAVWTIGDWHFPDPPVRQRVQAAAGP
jgi:hypothetical protein